MSWWESLVKGITFGAAGAFLGNQNDKAQGDQRKLINEQVKAYQQQTALTRQELESKRNEGLAEKRRIEEKQIRSLRRNYRSTGGILGTGAPASPDMSSQLGN